MPKGTRVPSGRLLARIDPKIHKQARITAAELDCTLAKFVEEALIEKIARHQRQLPNQPNADDDQGDEPHE